jgi:preprotein translocase subunit YajC
MGDSGGFSFLLSLVLVFAVMYFMILRPQARRQKEREQLLKSVQKGDRVLTTSGFHATVLAVKNGDTLVVRLGDTLKVDMSRQAVQSVLERGAGGE